MVFHNFNRATARFRWISLRVNEKAPTADNVSKECILGMKKKEEVYQNKGGKGRKERKNTSLRIEGEKGEEKESVHAG